jgi:hypothetical protein
MPRCRYPPDLSVAQRARLEPLPPTVHRARADAEPAAPPQEVIDHPDTEAAPGFQKRWSVFVPRNSASSTSWPLTPGTGPPRAGCLCRRTGLALHLLLYDPLQCIGDRLGLIGGLFN